MKALIATLLLLSSSFACIAQKQLKEDEVQYFFRLIRQTKEFRVIKAEVDSINSNGNNIPQELEIVALKQDSQSDNHIFWATVKRTIMGMSLAACFYSYDQDKRKIVAIQKMAPRFKAD